MCELSDILVSVVTCLPMFVVFAVFALLATTGLVLGWLVSLTDRNRLLTIS